jgi:hypothetical protein
MTTAHDSTAVALLAGIAAEPDEDAPRLVNDVKSLVFLADPAYNKRAERVRLTRVGPDHQHPRSHEGTSMATDQSTVTYKDIPGFPGYRAGSDGSIWSCRVPGSRNWQTAKNPAKWRCLVARPSTRGRPRVRIYYGHKRADVGVCRLILLAFVGPCPEGMEACHDPDPDPNNNRIENLRWGTRKENAEDRAKHGRSPEGENNPNHKLTAKDIPEIFAARVRGESQSSIGARYGVGQPVISAILLGKRWKHLPRPTV